MRVFVSDDMEGITGVAAAEDVVRGEPEYERGKELLHGDVNAAIDGAFEGGATEVLVNDSHFSMRNLDRAELDDRAILIRGNTKPRSMMQGLDGDHDCALFVGYHAKAGTAGAVLNHTFFGSDLLRLRANGSEVGELGWNARFAAAHGVPVGLVTGDDATAAEARDELGDAPETVAVKEGIDRFTARCRPASEARADVREAARRAVRRAGAGAISPAKSRLRRGSRPTGGRPTSRPGPRPSPPSSARAAEPPRSRPTPTSRPTRRPSGCSARAVRAATSSTGSPLPIGNRLSFDTVPSSSRTLRCLLSQVPEFISTNRRWPKAGVETPESTD